MRTILSSALKDSETLERGVVTGILRTAKEGIFSGLNNLEVATILDSLFQDKFGFTESETKLLLKDQELSDKMEEITDGIMVIHLGKTTIYNPWSILQCANKEGLIKAYWINTSDNALIKRLLIHASGPLKSELEDILTNKPIVKNIEEGITFSDIEKNNNTIWNLLLFSGYLTYSHLEWIELKAHMYIKNTQ